MKKIKKVRAFAAISGLLFSVHLAVLSPDRSEPKDNAVDLELRVVEGSGTLSFFDQYEIRFQPIGDHLALLGGKNTRGFVDDAYRIVNERQEPPELPREVAQPPSAPTAAISEDCRVLFTSFGSSRRVNPGSNYFDAVWVPTRHVMALRLPDDILPPVVLEYGKDVLFDYSTQLRQSLSSVPPSEFIRIQKDEFESPEEFAVRASDLERKRDEMHLARLQEVANLWGPQSRVIIRNIPARLGRYDLDLKSFPVNMTGHLGVRRSIEGNEIQLKIHAMNNFIRFKHASTTTIRPLDYDNPLVAAQGDRISEREDWSGRVHWSIPIEDARRVREKELMLAIDLELTVTPSGNYLCTGVMLWVDGERADLQELQ